MVIYGTASDTLTEELSAMQRIAVLLATLDEPARLRVLHWAIERFHGDLHGALRAPLPAAPPGAAVTADEPPDETLSVSSLTDLFDPRGPGAPEAPAEDTPRRAVSGLLSEFVAEFQDVVREWNAASETPADAGNQRASSAA